MLQVFVTVFFLLICAFNIDAATVRLNDDDTPIVNLVTASNYSLVVDSPSGDATSESAPAKTYIPIKSDDGTTDSEDYFTVTATAVNLPTGASAATMTGTISFSLDTDSVSGTEYLHAAIKDTSSSVYKVLNSVAVTVNEDNKTFQVTLSDMCSAGSADLDCSNIFSGASPSVTLDTLVYFYINSTQDGDGNTIDPGAKTGGIFYEVNISNRIYSNTITMSELVKGDSRLTAVYQGFTFEELDNVSGFDFGTNGCQTLFTNTAGQGTVYETDVSATSGEAAFKGLINDRNYKFAIFFEDKFKFSSALSNCIEGTPQEIEALLKKNSCFLLTAGFGGDHRIIDYFRKFRDETLVKNIVGKKFIDIYYVWGPKFAPVVLNNPWLAKTVRGGAYVAFWVMEYRIWLVMLVFAMGLALGMLMLVLNRNEGAPLWQVTVNSPTSSTEKVPKTQNAEKSLPNS